MHSGAAGPTPWPFVAVIVPVYNDAERLAKCLQALERQTYPADRHEVLVVDNGSSEDIAPACRPFVRVRCLHEPKPGSYAARNKGIACTEAEILAFTDSDCIPHRDWLENGVRRLIATPDCDLVGGNVTVFPKDRARRTAVELYESAFAFPQKRRIEESHWSVTANLFVRRRVIAAVGSFNDALQSGGDAEWGRRASAAGQRITYAEEARVDHPARASLGELLSKARRVGGGAAVLRGDASMRSLAGYLARSMVRCSTKTLRILAGDSFNAGSQRFTMLERFKISIALNLFTIRRLTEVVRLRLSKGPARRA